ncbi:MAG: alpha/beta fold hydrolase [Gammaproteobacteria bacterium]
MTTFVLVHGLGLGGWCWKRVSTGLREQGHTVLTPTLTGLGERSHLATPDINLDTHITDVINVLKWEDLHDVILVGHSYGGAVVTGAADREADRIKKLVYLDAFVLQDGQSVMDLQTPERIEYMRKKVDKEGDGWLLQPNPPAYYGVTDPDDQKWMGEFSVGTPFATLLQRISLIYNSAPPYPRAYIWASGFTPSPFVETAEKCRNDPDWEYREIPSDHMAMLSHADELVDVLTELL